MADVTLETLVPQTPLRRQCRQCFMTGKACMYEREIMRALKDVRRRTASEASSEDLPTGSDSATDATPHASPDLHQTAAPGHRKTSSSNTPNDVAPRSSSDARKPSKSNDQSSPPDVAFAIMPFRPLMDEIYATQLEPCLKKKFSCVKRADDVQRTGYIICEKICKEIQSAHLIAAEISSDNHNVFYELGLAYALGVPIALFIQKDRMDARALVTQRLGIRNFLTPYLPFGEIKPEDVRIWQRGLQRREPPRRSRKGDLPPIVAILADTSTMTEQVGNELFRYTVDAYCKKQIQLAISSMRKPQAESAPAVSQRRDPASSENKNLQFFATNEQSDFDAIESAIDRAKCVIICTSSEDPLSYFWLGFAHGNQKQVIPITALPSREDGGRDATASSSDMPFDVRALWHIHFDKGDPKTLRSSLVDILHHLLRDEDIANRKEFWRDILEEGTVSLFVGAVALGDRSRNVVGEWDYRTMAELCGFLVRLKETTEIMIQPPLYRASEKKKGAELEQYIDDLGRKLLANNAIVIATPDSNDMTEVALARLADKSAFKNDRRDNDPDFCGIVAVKTERDVKGGNCRYYRYEDLSRDQGTKLDPKRTRRTDTKRAKTPDAKRGFIDYYKGQELKERYWHQYGDHTLKHPDGYTFYHGHLAKFRLREATKANDSENAEARWVIVVQGITGPATLGLAQILTGAHYKHFTVFDDAYPEEDRNRLLLSVAKHAESLRDLRGRPIAGDADPSKSLMEQHAEEMARKMNEECEKHGSVEAIVRIYISDSHPDHDERLLIWWEFEEGFPRVASVHARHYPSSTGEGLDAEAAVARKTEVHSTG